ncbi:Leucine carboxyl methyltransferase [uncultured archaeon]|nr:Leucine carboxyl methyltransferase [uncultured archaeon]
MEGLENSQNVPAEANKWFIEKAGSSSKTAEGIATLRFHESQRPEGERICYDPYAIHFISPEILEWIARNPDKAKARWEQRERILPGIDNSVIARVRYFDDFVKRSINEGLEQLVILGAGYDSRAYRIEGLAKIKVFEVDHPAMQAVKIEKIKKIFGCLPDHVTYNPADLERDDFGQKSLELGYSQSKKTLFLMEGLLYYLPPEIVNKILSFISKNSGEGSAIIFDYYPQSVVDGSCELEVGRNLYNQLAQYGEPLRFGINDVEKFLANRGFSQIRNVTSEDYKRAYFHGINERRPVCSLLYFAHAVVE